MSCRCSIYTEDGPMCPATGDRCMFLIPNEKACYELYGEGPLEKDKNERKENK
ncbi:hypothetical protein [Clostridium algidicarnis]|uniref:hypothetical protein n=1 Tax=Clostridium algidicarnis TaxID=37659 RepID=UPI001C0D9587|nr:hypothetical protein [Clostridium algidicarnis]MBU3205159.1 hypothetical protein [Clostridium algidicarnis]MBU3213312.1 hypothetical protein [Clostridium algidicarnis]MBU3223793.1 hypothetical protein [Clostridium algidicarnis]